MKSPGAGRKIMGYTWIQSRLFSKKIKSAFLHNQLPDLYKMSLKKKKKKKGYKKSLKIDTQW